MRFVIYYMALVKAATQHVGWGPKDGAWCGPEEWTTGRTMQVEMRVDARSFGTEKEALLAASQVSEQGWEFEIRSFKSGPKTLDGVVNGLFPRGKFIGRGVKNASGTHYTNSDSKEPDRVVRQMAVAVGR